MFCHNIAVLGDEEIDLRTRQFLKRGQRSLRAKTRMLLRHGRFAINSSASMGNRILRL